MGFFDRIKQQAAHLKDQEKVKELAGKVKEKAEEVREKAEDFQAKRKADDMLDDLGRFLYAEKTDRPIPGADAEIARLVGELRVMEAEGLTILPAAEPAAGEPPAAPPAEGSGS